jgi:hypothetical protein
MKVQSRFIVLCAVVFLLAFVTIACGGRGARRIMPLPSVGTQTVQPGVEASFILPSGGGAIFPAGSFSVATDVSVSESMTAEQRDGGGFPPDSGLLLGSTSVQVTAGRTLLRDITVYIALTGVQTVGKRFIIFRFNPATYMWESTENLAAAVRGTSAVGTVGASGMVVSFVAPTEGVSGLNATYGVFANYVTTGGGGGVPEPNLIPTVDLAADATTVAIGETVTLTATGADADGDTLAFNWLAAAGTLGTPNTTGNTSTVTWSADAAGVYTVSVSVSDGNGGVDTDSVAITVPAAGPVNNPPVITDPGVSSDVAAPYETQLIIFSAAATDEDGDELTYAWSDDTGGNNFFDESVGETGGAQVWWNYDTAGTYTVTLTVSDGNGGTDEAAFDVTLVALPASFDWVGYAGCFDTCHGSFSDVTQAGWMTTRHANAFANSLSSGHGFRSESCYECHGVGIFPTGTGGFISEDVTPQFANIQCESCHGTGVGHPTGGPLPKPWDPGTGYEKDGDGNYVLVDGVYQYDEAYDGSNGYGCGLCHEGSRHGVFESYMQSVHGTFALYGDDGVTPNHEITNTGCVKCHNGAWYVEIQVHGGDPPAENLTELDESAHISCAVCHDPHDAQYEAQLRVDSEADVIIPFGDTPVSGGLGNICITCHNGRRTDTDRDNHITNGNSHFGMHENNQATLVFGIGGYEFPGFEYDNAHPHTTWNDNACVTCHMYRHDYIDAENPAEWGHTFEPSFEPCLSCHIGTVEDMVTYTEDFQAEIQALLDEFFTLYPFKDGDTLLNSPDDGVDDDGYREALWNYEFVMTDHSLGVHNPQYTKQLLESAIATLETLAGG